ncbi:hypothetical protein [Hydrogenovibrio halophilus]|uniref:hypothetical protein n=1 Tax=Hydrogenovibrio halophilus TaxID=373391 RepID=UPI0003A75462|nr:hypothetical protein [Hydrogenovibrio halophilus]
MSVKEEAQRILAELPDNADWNDLVKALYLNKKITLGMTDLELSKSTLTDDDVAAIMARLHSARAVPDDMRNTRDYRPGNAVTTGMVAGIIAIFFAFVFPPISWIAAPVAVVAGAIGLKNRQRKAWVPILMAVVSMGPMLMVLNEQFAYF